MMKSKTAFAAACAGVFLFGITLITLGSVATELKTKFSLDEIEAGTLFSILPFGILTGSLIFGPICDRYGYKQLLIASCVAMFAGFEGIAYAKGLSVLNVFVFVFGIGGGIINGATNAVVSDISEQRKGANLSLLGVFFGLGALGMPLVLGLFSKTMQPLQVVASVGWLTLLVGLSYAFVKFPPAKIRSAVNDHPGSLFKPLLLLIAFFLFFQSSFEAIINNWTITYLTNKGVMDKEDALYSLSMHIAGMVIMRLLTGSLFRKISEVRIMWGCLIMLLVGIVLMQAGRSAFVIIAGLIFSGAGLAGGFPLMLGFVGERFRHISATAFSFVFTFALIGNMLINYIMGLIAKHYGVNHLTTVAYTEVVVMIILFYTIIKKLKTK